MYKLNKKGGRFAKIDAPKAKGEADIEAFDERIVEMQKQLIDKDAAIDALETAAAGAEAAIAELTAKLEELSKNQQ